MKISIKGKQKDKRFGHSGISKKLGEHTNDELVKLAILGHESGNSLILDAFDHLPTLAELKGEKVDSAIAKVITESNKPTETAQETKPATEKK